MPWTDSSYRFSSSGWVETEDFAHRASVCEFQHAFSPQSSLKAEATIPLSLGYLKELTDSGPVARLLSWDRATLVSATGFPSYGSNLAQITCKLTPIRMEKSYASPSQERSQNEIRVVSRLIPGVRGISSGPHSDGLIQFGQFARDAKPLRAFSACGSLLFRAAVNYQIDAGSIHMQDPSTTIVHSHELEVVGAPGGALGATRREALESMVGAVAFCRALASCLYRTRLEEVARRCDMFSEQVSTRIRTDSVFPSQGSTNTPPRSGLVDISLYSVFERAAEAWPLPDPITSAVHQLASSHVMPAEAAFMTRVAALELLVSHWTLHCDGREKLKQACSSASPLWPTAAKGGPRPWKGSWDRGAVPSLGDSMWVFLDDLSVCWEDLLPAPSAGTPPLVHLRNHILHGLFGGTIVELSSQSQLASRLALRAVASFVGFGGSKPFGQSLWFDKAPGSVGLLEHHFQVAPFSE